MLNCVIKSGPEYDALAEVYGEVGATYLFRLNNNSFPTVEQAEIMLRPHVPTNFDQWKELDETKDSFTNPKLGSLQDVLSATIGKFKVVSRPSSGLIVNGAINESFLEQNEVGVEALLPLYMKKFKDSPTILNRIKSYLGDDFDTISEIEQSYRLNNLYERSSEGTEYIKNLMINQMSSKGHSPKGKFSGDISAWTDLESSVQFSITEDGNPEAWRAIYGTVHSSELSDYQKEIQEAFKRTDLYFAPAGSDKNLTHRQMRKEDFEPWEWRQVENIAKGKGYIERYVLTMPINGKYYVLHRVSDGKANEINKRKSEEELRILDENSQIYQMTGTKLHEVKENAIKNLFYSYDNSIYKSLREAIIKNKTITRATLDHTFAGLWKTISQSQEYIDYKTAWLNDPACPFTDTITTYKEDGTAREFTKHGNASSNYDKMLTSLLKSYIEFTSVQVGIDWETNSTIKEEKDMKWHKANFYAEKRVLDIANSTVGTLDLTVIYSDKTASIFDYKFMKAKTKFVPVNENDPDSKKVEVLDVDLMESTYMKSKMETYDDQISKYSNILKTVYGVKRVRSARIDPAYVKYTADAGGNITNTSKVFGIYTNEEAFGVIPTQAERTGHKAVDKFLDSVEKQIAILNNKLSTTRTWSIDTVSVAKLAQLRKIMRAIQVNGDFQQYFEYVTSFVTRTNTQTAAGNTDKLKIADLNNIIDEAKFIISFLDESSNILQPFEAQNPTMVSSFKKNVNSHLGDIRTALETVRTVMLEKVEQVAVSKGMRSEVFKTYETDSDVNAVRGLALGLQNINHAFAQTLARAVSESTTAKHQFLREIGAKNEIKLKALKEWASGKGLKGIDIFKGIINKRQQLITPYTENYYAERRAHANTAMPSNIEWYSTNFHRSTERVNGMPSDEDRFQQNLERRKLEIEVMVAGKPTEEARKAEYDRYLNLWLEHNDINHKDFKAWAENVYISPKNPSAWYSPEYLEMMAPGNEPLRDYYEFLLEMNQIFTKKLGTSIKIGSNFIPNIEKQMMDGFLQDGITVAADAWKKGQELWHGIKKMYNNKHNITKKKGTDGKNVFEMPEIPVMFINNLDEASDKSLDLGKNLMLFAAFVSDYEHMTQIKELGSSLMYLAKQQKYAETDVLGNKIEDSNDVTGFKRSELAESNLYKVLKSNVEFYVFGNEEADDVITKTLGPTANKIVGKIIGETSRQAMTLNIMSASAGFLNSQLQITYLAAAGKYFTHKQHGAAVKMAVTADPKLIWASLFFGVNSTDTAARFTADGQSAYDINKFNRHSIGMFFQHFFDKMDDKILLASMMQNYGIDPETNQVTRLEKIREKYANNDKYKDVEFKSVLESIEEVNISADEGTYRLVNPYTGKEVKISYLDPNADPDDNAAGLSIINSMRRKVTRMANITRGAISEDDRARYTATILGKALGQFRRWMPGTFNVRLKGEGYDDALEEFEVGRWVATGKLALKMRHNLILAVIKSITPGNSIYAELNNEAMKEMYEAYIKENPTLAGVVSYEDYVREYSGQIKSMLWEIMMFTIIAFLLTSLLAFVGGGDDDEESYILGTLAKLLNRTILEIGIFVPVVGISEMGTMLSRDPFPLIRTLYTAANFGYEAYDESRDAMFGEDNPHDRSGFLKYASKVIGASPILSFTGLNGWVNDGKDTDDGIFGTQDDSKNIYKK